MNSWQAKWNERYQDKPLDNELAPVLRDNLHLLPATGRALDLACGLSVNTLTLARHGLDTHAWDFSSCALQKLQQHAAEQDLRIHCSERDVELEPPEPSSFDVIVVVHFLQRRIAPALVAALKPNGLLFYQTFCQQKTDPAAGPVNPDFLLARGELLQLFSGLSCVAYREEGRLGNHAQGLRNQAYLVAKKTHVVAAPDFRSR